MGLPIVMQFSFAHYAAIPESLKHLLEQKGSTDEQKEVSRGGSLQARQETFKDRDRRKQVSNGRCIVQPRLRVAIRPFLQRLKTAGYVLCNARIEQRIKSDERGCTQYWMIRFSFSDVFTGELVNTSLYWRALYELADALWRVRVFRNPQKDGDGEFYGINMEVREPLWRSDGVPVCEWEHGGDGARVGDAPVPLRHKGTLLFGGTEGIFVHD